MYELKKTKSYGSRIIIGIAILFLLSAVLKMIFNEKKPLLSDELIELANNINEHAPVVIDSTTRFDNMVALSDYKLQYNYTLLQVVKSDVDTAVLFSTGKEYMLNMMKSNPQVSVFKKNGIDIWASYSDKNGVYIGTVKLPASEF